MRFALIILYVNIHLSVYSQYNLLYNFSTKDGIPSNTVYSLAEDESGHIWLGNKNGLTRYDGESFRTFNVRDGLLDNEVLGIFHIGNNKFIANSFLDKLSFGDGHRFYSYNKQIKQSKLSDFVFKGEKTPYRNPTIIFNTDSSYFIKLNINQNSIYEVINNKIIDPRRRLGLDSNINLLWVHKLNDKELLLIGRNTGSYYGTAYLYFNKTTIKFPNKILVPDAIHSFGQMIYCAWSDTIALYRINTKKNKLDFVRKIKLKYSSHKLIVIDNSIVALNKRGYSNVFDTLLNTSTQLDIIRNIKNISDIHVDRNKNIWISTLTSGVYLIKNSPLEVFSTKNGLKNNNIQSVLTLDSDKFIVGDSEGRVYMINAKTKPKIRLLFETRNSPSNEFNIVHRIISANNKIIILTNSTEYNLTILDKTYKILDFKVPKELSLIKSITKLDETKIILGTISGAYILNLQTYSVTKMPVKDIRFSSVFVTKSGDIWIGSNNGIYCYKVKEGKTIHLGNRYDVCNNRALSFCETNDGIIWVGTSSHGLLAFQDYNMIVHLNSHKGIASANINSVISNNQELWIATNSSVYTIKYSYGARNELKITNIKNFSSIGSLNTGEINTLAISGNKILLGTNEGLIATNINKFTEKETVNTILSSIKVNNLDKPIKNSLTLPYYQNTISLKYTGITYARARENTYVYRILGIQDSFQTTEETMKEFGPLSPGKYKFEVYCADESGLPLGKKAYLNIVILPAFYQTHWFIGVCILLISLLLFIIQKLISTQKQKESKRKLEISELEMQAIRAQMNPHFIFNCLNGIQQLINVQDNEKANKYIAKFAKLIRQTLELSKNNTISLSEEIDFLENYLYLEELRFQDKFDFEIICDSEIDYNQTKIPSMLLQPYVENSIRHGIKYLTNKKGQIIIEFKKKENTILCTITDNGIGRKASAEMKYSNSIEYQSRGTELNQKRIASYNKMNQEKIDLLINDLQNEKGLSIGTQVIITLQKKMKYDKSNNS